MITPEDIVLCSVLIYGTATSEPGTALGTQEPSACISLLREPGRNRDQTRRQGKAGPWPPSLRKSRGLLNRDSKRS